MLSKVCTGVVLLSLFASCGGSGGGTTATIGPAGGVVTDDSGAQVTIPAGALGSDVEIGVAEVPAGDLAALPAGVTLSGGVFAFTPHGTTFTSPVTIRLPYAGTANVVLRLGDESDTTWEAVAGVTFTSGVATFETSTFSLYAAAEDSGAACGPPTAGTAGAADVTGASFPVVDAVARVRNMVDVATEGGTNPFRTELHLRFTSYADACSSEDAGIFARGSEMVELILMRNSDTANPGLPPAGTYPFDTTLPMANDGTTYFNGGNLMFDCNSDCQWCASHGSTTPSGSVTLTSVTDTSVAGTFTFTDMLGTTYSGSFTAPVCGTTDANPTYCCWTT